MKTKFYLNDSISCTIKLTSKNGSLYKTKFLKDSKVTWFNFSSWCLRVFEDFAKYANITFMIWLKFDNDIRQLWEFCPNKYPEMIDTQLEKNVIPE